MSLNMNMEIGEGCHFSRWERSVMGIYICSYMDFALSCSGCFCPNKKVNNDDVDTNDMHITCISSGQYMT